MGTPIKKGLTTIQWGSGGTTNGGLSGAVVVRGTFTPKNGDPIEIEDNEGFAKSLILLDDGFNATVECLYDSAIAWPAVGDTVQLKRPSDAAPINCLLSSREEATERKKESSLTMRLVYRPGVALV